MTHWRAWAVLMAAGILIVGAGARNVLVEHVSTGVVIPVSENRAAARSNGGNAYIVDLSRYRLSRYSDSENHPFRSRFILTEDGRPFQAHTMHAEIRAGYAKFSHWHDALFFSTSDGSNPFANGRSYVLSGKVPPRALGFLPYTDAIAIVGLALLLLVQWRFAGSSEQLVSRLGLPLLVVAFGFSYAFQLYPTAAHFAISPDSESYTWNADNPERSIRPPGYAVFMNLVSDAREVGLETRALTKLGKVNQVLTDRGSEALRKVVWAQKVCLAVALITVFMALSTFMPLLLAAAVTLGVGYFPDKSEISWIVARPAWEILTALLLGIAGLAALRRHTSLARGAAIAAALGIALYPVVRMLLDVRMVPEGTDYIMSETLTMATQLLVVSCLCCFLCSRKAVWLYLAAGAFALSVWMRPAAIFELGMIILAVVAALGFRPRPSILVLGGTVVLSVVLIYAPTLQKRITSGSKAESISMTSWSLACFALEVAQPEDVKLMPSPTAVRFFKESLSERNNQLAQHDIRSGPAFNRLGLNLYHVALPVAARIVGDYSISPAVSNLLYEFAIPIYKARAKELIQIWAESFRFAITDGTRLSQGQPLWWTLIGLLALVYLVRGPMVIAGSILLLGHFGHVLVASVFDAPIARYVYATEFLLVVGLALVIVAAAKELVRVSQAYACSARALPNWLSRLTNGERTK